MHTWVTQPLKQALCDEVADKPTTVCGVVNAKTAEKLYQRNFHTVKSLGPTTDFPTWGFSKGTENTQGI